MWLMFCRADAYSCLGACSRLLMCMQKEEPDEVIRSPFDDQVPSPRSQASDFLEPIAEGSFKLDGDAAPPTPQPQAHHNHARDGNLAAHTFAMPPHLHRCPCPPENTRTKHARHAPVNACRQPGGVACCPNPLAAQAVLSRRL